VAMNRSCVTKKKKKLKGTFDNKIIKSDACISSFAETIVILYFFLCREVSEEVKIEVDLPGEYIITPNCKELQSLDKNKNNTCKQYKKWFKVYKKSFLS
jgi:hypothetical protein